MKKLLLILSFVIFISSGVNAQNSAVTLEKGVTAHKEIDAIYQQFNAGYKNLDVDAVANLYAENANYLAPDSPMLEGRAQIRESFDKFFSFVRQNGQTMEITFRILRREVSKDLGYDVGIYTLKTSKDGRELLGGQGKFVVITKKIGKKWVFQYDSYANLPSGKKKIQQ